MTQIVSTTEHPSRRIVRIGRWSLALHPRSVVVGSILLVAVVLVSGLSLNQGSTQATFGELLTGVWHPGEKGLASIVWDYRLPRILSGLAIGAALAVSGSVFQSLSRNALGSPEIIGFTAGASSGAVFAIVVLSTHGWGIAVAACAGGLIVTIAVVGLSWRHGTLGGDRLVLVGIGVNALLQAVNALILTRSDAEVAIAGQIWLTGTLNAREWGDALLASGSAILLIPVLFALTRRLNTLELGEEFATSAGVSVAVTQLCAIVVGVVLVALATVAAGPISFVALAAGHLTRALVRSGTVPVVTSALMGALLLTVADVASQALPPELRVPVGVTTAVFGGLYLLWMLGRIR